MHRDASWVGHNLRGLRDLWKKKQGREESPCIRRDGIPHQPHRADAWPLCSPAPSLTVDMELSAVLAYAMATCPNLAHKDPGILHRHPADGEGLVLPHRQPPFVVCVFFQDLAVRDVT